MRARQIRAHLRHHPRVINGLRLLWITFVFWFEVGVFVYSISRCPWPDNVFRQADPSAKPAHILIVADPQVLDSKSLPAVSSLIRPFTRWVVDFNLRKSWRAALKLHPQEVIFLGDMLNGGRYARDADQYARFTARFKDIFKPPQGTKVHFVVGNHDVGLGKSRTFSSQARQRYQANFGPANDQISIGNHTVFLLDSPSLVEEDYTRNAADVDYDQWPGLMGGTIQFVNKATKDIQNSTQPTLFFTHIPLMRPEGASCGPLREASHGPKASIRKGAGDGYQNLLGRLTSTFLLEALQPVAIFSADDHDYCEYVHHYGQDQRSRRVREVSVKSISTITGLERPAVQLLSLWAPNGRLSASTTYSDRLCLLPNQSFIHWRCYFPLTIISLFLLVYLNTTQSSFLSLYRRSRGSSLISGASAPPNGYGRNNSLSLGTSPKLTTPARPSSPTLWLRSQALRPTQPSPSPSPGLPGGPPVHGPVPHSPVLVPATPDQDGEDEYAQVITVNSYRRPASFLVPPSPLSSTWAETPLVQKRFAGAGEDADADDEENVKNPDLKEKEKEDLEAGFPLLGSSRRNTAGFGGGGGAAPTHFVGTTSNPSRKIGLNPIGQQQAQVRRSSTRGFYFFFESEREKDKRMERKSSWGVTPNLPEAFRLNFGRGIAASLVSGMGMAIGVLRRFVIGRQITGSFWTRLLWDLLIVAWPPLLVLAGIVMRLTQ